MHLECMFFSLSSNRHRVHAINFCNSSLALNNIIGFGFNSIHFKLWQNVNVFPFANGESTFFVIFNFEVLIVAGSWRHWHYANIFTF